MIKSLEFSVPPTNLQAGREAGDWVNKSIIHVGWSFHKTLWDSGSFWIGNHIYVLGGWGTPTPQGQKLLCSGSFQTSPYVPPHLFVHLCPLFLSSCIGHCLPQISYCLSMDSLSQDSTHICLTSQPTLSTETQLLLHSIHSISHLILMGSL